MTRSRSDSRHLYVLGSETFMPDDLPAGVAVNRALVQRKRSHAGRGDARPSPRLAGTGSTLLGPGEVGKGFVNWNPDGAVIIRLLEAWLRGVAAHEFGGEEIITPTIHPVPEVPRSEQADFAGRQFRTQLTERGDPFCLRYAADYGHFRALAAYDRRRDPDEIVSVWEYGTFFRRYRSGEVGGLVKLREFHQLDHHTICSQGAAIDEFDRLLRAQVAALRRIGLTPCVEVTVVESEYPSISRVVEGVSAWMQIPILLETVKAPTNYWSAKSFVFVPGPYRTANLQLDSTAIRGLPDSRERAVLHCTMSSPERLLLAINNQPTTPDSVWPVNGWPFWLAPTQVRILPTRQDLDFAAVSSDVLRGGFRVDVDRTRSLGSRIFAAHQDGVPVVIVIGERELADGTVCMRVGHESSEPQVMEAVLAVLDGMQNGLPRRPALRPDRRLQYWGRA